MISFRFHVVSLTAVFLAIAIGVVVGTTYVDQAVVDGLENRVDTVSRNLDERKAQNDALQGDLDRLQGYAGASADFAVTRRLTDVPVVLFAARGVDEDVASRTLALARTAGARVPGIVWLEERWALEGDDDASALADAVGSTRTSATSVRDDALVALVGALGLPVPEADPAAAPAVLNALVQGGFVSVDAQGDESPELATFANQAPRVLLLTTSRIGKGLSLTVGRFAERSAVAGLATVAAEAYQPVADGPDRGEAILASLSDAAREKVGVVDDLELSEGQVATILAVAEVAAGRVAHLGYGPGADGPLPAWTAP